jgi:hypothetical protein
MSTPTLWLEITIAGSPLLAAAFFLTLSILGIKDLSELGITADYLPYLSVVSIVASFLAGIVMLRIGQILISAISRKSGSSRISVVSITDINNSSPGKRRYGIYAYEDLVMVWQKGSDRLCAELDRQYSLLALFGSLLASTPILGLSVFVWLQQSGQAFVWLPLMISALFMIGLSLAFGHQWYGYMRLRTAAIAEVRR